MLKSRWIDRICCIVLAVTVIITLLFMNGGSLGMTALSGSIGYEDRLFDRSRVHTIDIVTDDWEGFLENCTDEEYILCDIVIDGESLRNVGLRAKGNSSLTSVASYGSSRYSFKVELDHYDSTKSYHGLDKFSLNNIIQDNTYMKDFFVYTMMGEMGVASPLCSFAYITVNGEDWGLYLAVETPEESFLERNYGSDYGNLYKPDSMDMGGGRGNGKDFDMEQFQQQMQESEEENEQGTVKTALEQQGFDTSALPDQMEDMGSMEDFLSALGDIDMATLMQAKEDGGLLPDESERGKGGWNMDGENGGDRGDFGGFGGFGGFGSGSDVKLQYIDDDPDSYASIFDSAKTDITEADKKRLIASLKKLSAQEDLEEALNIETVIRYFVVHDFVQNGDSYTGTMIHNYYLYEKNGQMEMIPWDYNLAFGAFGMGGFGSEGSGMTATVNSPIDSPVSGGDMSDRPMVAWIFGDEAYTELYHEIYQKFITDWFGSGKLSQLIEDTAVLISPYVEKDPTAFCSYEEFQAGVAALKQFCALRAESVQGQLDGTIPSTSEGQAADSSSLIDASHLNSADMGNQSSGRGGNAGGQEMGRDKMAFGGFHMNDGTSDGSSGAANNGNSGTETAPLPPDSGEGGSPDMSQKGAGRQQMQMQGEQPQPMPDQQQPQGEQPPMQDNQQLEMQNEQPPMPETEKADMAAMPADSRASAQPAGSPNTGSGTNAGTVWMLGISAAVLLAGLIFARLYRHHI